jgi:hypothetical protein
MGEMRNAYKVLSENVKGKGYWGDIDVAVRIILK